MKDILYIEDCADLCKAVLEASDNGKLSVAIIGDYETIVGSLNYLVKNTDSDFINGNLIMPMFSEYEGPLYLQFDEREIWCGEAKKEDGNFLYFEEDVEFVMSEYLEDYLNRNKNSEPIVFVYDEEADDEDHDGDCLCMDDDSCGFTFCSNGDGSHYKFRFKTNRKMTEEEAWQLALKYI